MSTLDDRLAALDAELAPLPGVARRLLRRRRLRRGARRRRPGAGRRPGRRRDRGLARACRRPSGPPPPTFVASLGVRHEFRRAPTSSSREGYRANAGDRCAFCKSELVDVLTPLAARLGIADVVTGTNADDLRAGFRPGIRAAAERGAWAPLARAGMTKDDVRAAARRWELPLADKPAAACLASRIAYGVPVSRRGAGPGRAAEAGAARGARRRPGCRCGTCGCATSAATPPGSRSTPTRVAELAARPDLLAAVAGFERVEVDPRGLPVRAR